MPERKFYNNPDFVEPLEDETGWTHYDFGPAAPTNPSMTSGFPASEHPTAATGHMSALRFLPSVYSVRGTAPIHSGRDSSQEGRSGIIPDNLQIEWTTCGGTRHKGSRRLPLIPPRSKCTSKNPEGPARSDSIFIFESGTSLAPAPPTKSSSHHHSRKAPTTRGRGRKRSSGFSRGATRSDSQPISLDDTTLPLVNISVITPGSVVSLERLRKVDEHVDGGSVPVPSSADMQDKPSDNEHDNQVPTETVSDAEEDDKSAATPHSQGSYDDTPGGVEAENQTDLEEEMTELGADVIDDPSASLHIYGDSWLIHAGWGEPAQARFPAATPSPEDTGENDSQEQRRGNDYQRMEEAMREDRMPYDPVRDA